MREIKFRAWDSAKKIMRSVVNIYTHSHSVFVLVREATGGPPELIRTECLMQYIGAKDKNGVEIYEGDIIRGNARRNQADYVIRWCEGKCGFIADPLIADRVWPGLNQGTTIYYEVIGNIYENPELVSVDEGLRRTAA